MDDSTMRGRVAEARVGRLATLTDAGSPHLVPCCFVVDHDVVYSAVDGKPKSTRALRRVANVRADPRVSLLIDHYDDADWSALWWVRIDGRARVLDPTEDVEEAARALDLLAAKYPQYRELRPPGPVLAVDIIEWRAWSPMT